MRSYHIVATEWMWKPQSCMDPPGLMMRWLLGHSKLHPSGDSAFWLLGPWIPKGSRVVPFWAVYYKQNGTTFEPLCRLYWYLGPMGLSLPSSHPTPAAAPLSQSIMMLPPQCIHCIGTWTLRVRGSADLSRDTIAKHLGRKSFVRTIRGCSIKRHQDSGRRGISQGSILLKENLVWHLCPRHAQIPAKSPSYVRKPDVCFYGACAGVSILREGSGYPCVTMCSRSLPKGASASINSQQSLCIRHLLLSFVSQYFDRCPQNAVHGM